MNSIRETVRAIMDGDLGAIKISRRERKPLDKGTLDMVTKRVAWSVSAVAAAVVVVNAETEKVLILAVLAAVVGFYRMVVME